MIIARTVAALAPLVLVALAISPAPLQADFVKVDISGIVNSDLADYTNGGFYPGPGPITIGGIPFDLAAGADGNTWVVGGLASIGTAQSYAINGLGITGVTSMYAIINSAFGACGVTVGSIGASTAGSSITFDLVEGQNVRDHYNGVFCNTETDAIATANYGGDVRFDVYRFDLSALTNNGAIPITGFNFDTFGQGGAGEPLLGAVTLGTVPEPSSWTMLALAALALVGLSRWRRISQP